MSNQAGMRRSGIHSLKNGLLLLCLFAPSLWMLKTIPPLWRDADGYVQLTADPLVATFWGHAPAYCYVARIPLFIGEYWERFRGIAIPPSAQLATPAITDAGVALLIGAQHLALGLSIFYFISAVSRRFWVRSILAVVWASNPLFYTFAHCVGSETLGMILIIVLALKGLPLSDADQEIRWKDWYVFAVVLLLSFLSRDLNRGLLLLLPLTLLLGWLFGRRTLRNAFLRCTVIAVAVGTVTLFVANSLPRTLARKTHLRPHSRIGFTYLWHLRALGELPAEERTALLRQVGARAHSQSIRDLIALLDKMLAESSEPLDQHSFVNRAVWLFGGPPHWEELDRGLNELARTFLWPPLPELTKAAGKDFTAAMTSASTSISDQPFATTSYYFEHREEMPAMADLLTFRDNATAAAINELPHRYSYFQMWRGVTYLEFLIAWLAVLGSYIAIALRRDVDPLAGSCYAVGLTIVGLLILAAACVLHDYEPRFGLSMWELLLLSLFLLAGRAAELFVGVESPPGSCSPRA